MSEDRVAGACLCGAVRFHIQLPTNVCVHCHCSMCRRNHGAGFVTWFSLPRDQFEIDQGEETLVRFTSSDHGSRSFCGRCGSSLFCESTTREDEIDIVLANMEASIDRQPQFHIFFDDRADWVTVGDALPRLGGDTGTELIESADRKA